MSREQFEAWWEINYHNGNPPRFGWAAWRDGDGYKIDDDESELDGMWNAWQAATNAMEAKCAALAAENAALNDKMDKLATWPGIEFYSSSWEFNNGDGNDALEFMCDVQTPATDAFLAELRAGAIEEFMEKSLWDTVDCLHGIGAFDKASDREEVQGMIRDELKERVSEFAAQLRKGAAQ